MKTTSILRVCLVIACIIGIHASCMNNSANNDERSPVLSDDLEAIDTLNTLAGTWISKGYFKSIMAFKSPRKAQDGSSFIKIPDKTLQSTFMTFNFHEGGGELQFVKGHKEYEVWRSQEGSITEKAYTVQQISSEEIKLGHETYLKIDLPETEDDYKILETILFAGRYTNASGDQIEFKNNGHLVGLADYQLYEPMIDYYDVGRQIDQIGFGVTTDNMKWFGFTFNLDTLMIHEISCVTFESSSGGCVEVEYGEIAHKIWREYRYKQ